MIAALPTLGIRFDVGKIDSGSYGTECWKVLWRAADAVQLPGALLFEGDTAASLGGDENVYCIAVQSPDASALDRVRAALEHSDGFRAVAARPAFAGPDDVGREPLVDAGTVDAGGHLVGNAGNARIALGAVQRERRGTEPPGPPAAPAPERRKPASPRTADLPAIGSVKELLAFLLDGFGEKNRWQFWITPEELCDVVEHCADVLQPQWNEGSCGLSTDMSYVTLFNKGQAGENIALHGLFPFATEAEARRYCRDPREILDYLIGQVEQLFGIRGRFATNFTGGSHSNFVSDGDYDRGQDIAAHDLWPRICRRRETLGIPASVAPPAAAAPASTAQPAATTPAETAPPAVAPAEAEPTAEAEPAQVQALAPAPSPAPKQSWWRSLFETPAPPASQERETPVVAPPPEGLTFAVRSVAVKQSHEYGRDASRTTITAAAAYRIMLAEITITNTTDRARRFSSQQFAVVDDSGKSVEASFYGVGDTLARSGAVISTESKTSGPDGRPIVSYKGKLSTDVSFLEWELHPRQTYEDTLAFVIPAGGRGVALRFTS